MCGDRDKVRFHLFELFIFGDIRKSENVSWVLGGFEFLNAK